MLTALTFIVLALILLMTWACAHFASTPPGSAAYAVKRWQPAAASGVTGYAACVLGASVVALLAAVIALR